MNFIQMRGLYIIFFDNRTEIRHIRGVTSMEVEQIYREVGIPPCGFFVAASIINQ